MTVPVRQAESATEIESYTQRIDRRIRDRQRNDESIQVGVGVATADSTGVLPAAETSQEFRGHLPWNDQGRLGSREICESIAAHAGISPVPWHPRRTR